MSHNLLNGMPPQMNKLDEKTINQGNYALNGLGSSQSSRDHSPLNTRLNPIPASQLPPARTNIPLSQLPPSASQGNAITQLTKNYGHLTVSNGNSNSNVVTPYSSPGGPKFTTSTPNSEMNKSVITSSGQGTNNSTGSYFDNVKLNQKNICLPTKPVLSGNYFSSINPEVYGSSSSEQLQDINKLTQNVHSVVQTPSTVSQGQIDLVKSSTCENESTPTTNIQTQQQVMPEMMYRTSMNQQMEQQNFAIRSSTTLQQSAQQNFLATPLTQAVPTIKQTSSAAPVMPQNIQNVNTNLTSVSKPPLQHHLSQPQMPSTILQQNMQQQQPNVLNQKSTGMYVSTPTLPSADYATTSVNQQYNLPPVKNAMPQGSQHNYAIPGQSTSTMHPTANQLQQMGYGTQANMPPTYNLTPSGQQPNTNVVQTSNYPPTYAPSSQQQGNTYQYGLNAPRQPPSNKSTIHDNRYPQQFNQQAALAPQMNVRYPPQSQVPNTYPQHVQKQQVTQSYQNVHQGYSNQVLQTGFNKYWGTESYDLLQCPNILPPTKVEPPKVILGQEMYDSINCSPEIFRCTMTKIPDTSTLLSKSRLPLGVLIHPFKDLYHLPVIQCNNIVRCRACRTYINPFVFFIDTKRWKCNICFRVNELPEEFQYDPVSKTYGDPSRRPEVKSSTIEYIAPAEYMLRPPQPAVYLYLLDVSRLAIESGYLQSFCSVLSSELSSLPGDARMQIGFLAYNSCLHFYSLAEGLSQPHEMVILDIDDVFLPCPDNLLVNLHDRIELVTDLLTQLPTHFNNSYDNNSALGAALQVAHKMMAATGGRITVFQAALPTIGPGALTPREDPSQRASTDVQHLNPANDFYKRLALECSGQQIAVDLFIINPQYVDLATISGISRFSGGCVYHFPLFKVERELQNVSFERSFRRYLTRKIGFEAVMRIRCTRGLSIHTFHGNFFVRSTDLLSLPNVNPDSGFGMQVAIEESLTDMQTVCFQAALLYTSSKGERRIRVHTLCVPVATMLTDVINSADQQCIIGLLTKMAVDRSMQSSLSDAREAFINVAIDILSSYKLIQNTNSGPTGLLVPQCLKLLPLYISAILKHVAFRTGSSTRLDDRVKAMCDMKVKPLPYLMQMIYPDLYPIHNLEDHESTVINEDEEPVPMPPHLQLTSRNLDSNGAYLMDLGEHMIIIIGAAINNMFINQVFGVPDYNSITENMFELPVLENPHNQRLHSFINYLNDDKPFVASLQILRDNSPSRGLFLERLIEDRFESSLSYHEFLQHLKTQVK